MSVLDGASATCAITRDTDSADVIEFQPSDCVDSIELAFSLLAPPSTLQFNFPSHQECSSTFLPASVENDAEKEREEQHDETYEAEADEADAEWRALKNKILEASWLNSAKGNGAQNAVFEAAELCVHFCEGVEYILLLRKTRARTKTQELRQELKNLRARNKIVVEEKVRMQKEMETARKLRGLDPAARARKEAENALMLEAHECVSNMEIEFQRLTEQLMEIKTHHLYLQQAQAKVLMNKKRLEEEMGQAKKTLESALEAQESMQQIADEEKQRRTEQANRFVHRLLYRKLACSFDSYANRVLEVRRQRETSWRVVLRLQQSALAGAFDLFIGIVGQLRRQRSLLEKMALRMRKKGMCKAWSSWDMTVKALRRQRSLLEKMTLRMRKAGMYKAWDSWHMDTAQVRRLHHNHATVFNRTARAVLIAKLACWRLAVMENAQKEELAYAFDTYACRVLEVKRQREKCRRAVLKMQKRVLSRAFGMFIGEVKDQREAKQQTTETQRVLDLTREELRREVKELHLMGNKFEADIADFTKVLRDQQDVHSYDSVVQSKDKKAICKRVIQRMLLTHLAVAFDCFCVAIHMRVAHRTTVTKTIRRTLKEMLSVRRRTLREMFERWFEYFDYAQECVGEERLVDDKQCRIEQAKRMSKAWHWWDMYFKVVRRLQGQSVLSKMAKTEKEELNRAVECETQRRTEQAKRIVQRELTEQAKRIVQRELAHQRWLRAQTKKVASYRRSAQKGKVGGMLPVPPLDSRHRALSLPPSLTPASPRSLYRDLSLSLSLSPRSLSLTLRERARDRESERDESTDSFSHERANERAR
jgi:hypothetical protein